MNYRNKSTGQLALITQLLSLAGSITRAFTIFVSANDLLYNVIMNNYNSKRCKM